MKCFEVTLNDGPPTIVGAAEAELIRGSLFLATKGRGGVVFSAFIQTEPTKSENLKWLSAQLQVGDELHLRVVESESPTPPDTRLLHGEGIEPDAPQLACSFCQRAQGEVKRLLATGNVSICGECVALCVESLASGSPSTPN